MSAAYSARGNLDKKAEAMERKESSLVSKRGLFKANALPKVEELFAKRAGGAGKDLGLTSDQAKEYLLKSVEADVKHDTAKLIKELEARQRKKQTKRPGSMWSQPSRDVRLTMWQRPQFLWYSSPVMR